MLITYNVEPDYLYQRGIQQVRKIKQQMEKNS